MLVKFIMDKKDVWDVFLDTCVYAYNTSVHKSTSFSPFEVMFGRRAFMPVDIEIDKETPIINNEATSGADSERLSEQRLKTLTMAKIDFVDQLHQVLNTIHSKGVEHCDLRLENICFRLARNQFRIVLIDLELAQLSNALRWKDVFDDRKTSCMYNKINDVASIDFHQLGYMILWVHYYDSLKRNHSALSYYDLYHSMHTYVINDGTFF